MIPPKVQQVLDEMRFYGRRRTPSEWADRLSAIIAKIEAQGAGQEPVGYFWFDPGDGGEWKHIADTEEQAKSYVSLNTLVVK